MSTNNLINSLLVVLSLFTTHRIKDFSDNKRKDIFYEFVDNLHDGTFKTTINGKPWTIPVSIESLPGNPLTIGHLDSKNSTTLGLFIQKISLATKGFDNKNGTYDALFSFDYRGKSYRSGDELMYIPVDITINGTNLTGTFKRMTLTNRKDKADKITLGPSSFSGKIRTSDNWK